MKTRALLLPLLLAITVAVPASAQGWRTHLQPVAGYELNKFVGTTLKGRAMAPIGVVASVNRNTGMIGLVGRHGEVAAIHNSLLYRDGLRLRAPEVSVADVSRASSRRIPLVRPQIIIEDIYID